ncbi:MAG: single-stranded DNA-binding protein [Nocardioidaceae bacterium]|nr:single-stranded DNA-binding protein [Nocardioidaceae bacterium]
MSNDNTIEHVTEDADHVDDHASLSVDAAIPADSDTEDDSKPARPSRVERLEAEGDAAADFLEELLDIADFDGDIDMDVEGDRASVSIVGGDLQDLVGRDGDVLDALQELTRLAVLRETGERSRLMLDIAGFRATRKGQLVEVAEKAIAHVKAEGAPLDLDPMTPFERKVVHDVVAAAGLSSESHGTEPRRYVVVVPSS